ncbi:TPA: type II toxin-antitoxin system RelE/ParE family toxin [Candidatus Woesearchaeota archaeon]|nr:addiction module toxin RelE [archaeon]HIJ10887.1 type II toxin-antitoxin system RelE/ParE family toxin [Candidatus Woesearchaeota archaeon]|tara:strand:- start:580 stop:861 length:282 start_codon:yes stop_codon:yes gene_type:complete
MSYLIVWDERARDFLRKIHNQDAKRIIKKVNTIIDEPRHYLETLVGIKSYKLRIGDYRALIDLNENTNTISVVLIGYRKDIYKYIQRSGFGKK